MCYTKFCKIMGVVIIILMFIVMFMLGRWYQVDKDYKVTYDFYEEVARMNIPPYITE